MGRQSEAAMHVRGAAHVAGRLIKGTAVGVWTQVVPHVDSALPTVVTTLQRWAVDMDGVAGRVRGVDRQSQQSRVAAVAMTPAERAEVEQLLSEADSRARGWVLGAVAAATPLTVLRRFAKHLTTMTPIEINALDITATPGRYAQPDHTTCGSASLVAARMRIHPAYAMYIVTGYDPVTGRTTTGTPAQRFGAAAHAMHDRTNRFWPKALGTTPRAAAAELNRPGGCGRAGVRYRVVVVDPGDPDTTYDRVAAAVSSGAPVPIFTYGGVGADRDGFRGGAHVVLGFAADGDNIQIFDPAEGKFTTLTRLDWSAQSTGGSLGWDNPFAVVVP